MTIVGGEPVLDIAVGDFHTCFLTPTRIRCIGKNDRGQLGDGTTEPSIVGVDVAL